MKLNSKRSVRNVPLEIITIYIYIFIHLCPLIDLSQETKKQKLTILAGIFFKFKIFL